MHANSISTINIMFSFMFNIKQVITVQTNHLIFFREYFKIPAFSNYILVLYILYKELESLVKSFFV